ncbi:ABC transporter [Butyricicoccus pullicaecorum]|uniref:ABC transporter n=1 Tax=Butyricicoccus pullicaecorum TaxID=501571 RepID=A0A1Y4L4X3_9FIRM|nr:ABC transporter ATP-binding protein [Butyricicoccus pullicaecorum]OUP50479.1 ABC transporter [Butyricicoccus pullicaecorum]
MEIRTDDLHAMLGGTEILHGIDFTAGDRSLVGVIGPNGSGKSTLLKCIYRVLKPSEGAVFVDGQPLSEYRVRDSAKKIAVLAQHNFYNFEFTVQDVVLMGRAPHKRALERDSAADFKIVHEAMERVGVASLRDRLFSTLSGGEQQRVLLARALAQQTPCLILDEPTNHLDIKYQLELLDLVRSLDRTAIAAIHDLNIAAMYCDTIFVMQSGHIVASGAPRDVLTRSLIRSVYEVDADVFTDSDGLLRVLFYPQSLV